MFKLRLNGGNCNSKCYATINFSALLFNFHLESGLRLMAEELVPLLEQTQQLIPRKELGNQTERVYQT